MVYGRSDLEIAEDRVLSMLELAQSQLLSREQAVRYQVDINQNVKYRNYINRGYELMDMQGEIPVNAWIDKAYTYALSYPRD